MPVDTSAPSPASASMLATSRGSRYAPVGVVAARRRVCKSKMSWPSDVFFGMLVFLTMRVGVMTFHAQATSHQLPATSHQPQPQSQPHMHGTHPLQLFR